MHPKPPEYSKTQKVYKSRKNISKPGVHVYNEMSKLLRSLGGIQATDILNTIAEANQRDINQMPARLCNELTPHLAELRGQSHSATGLGIRNTRYYYNIGYEKRCQGDFQKSEHHFRQSLILYPTDFKTLFNLGFVLGETERIDEAMNCFRQCLAQRPDIGYVHYNLGVCLLLKGLPASCSFDHAVKLCPDNIEFLQARALAHRRSKSDDFLAASNDYVRLRKTNPASDLFSSALYFDTSPLWKVPTNVYTSGYEFDGSEITESQPVPVQFLL